MSLYVLVIKMVIILTWLLDLMKATYFSSEYSAKFFGLMRLIIWEHLGLLTAANNISVSPNQLLYCKLVVNYYNNWNNLWGKFFTDAQNAKPLIWARWIQYVYNIHILLGDKYIITIYVPIAN